MTAILLDTDVLIEVLRARDAAILSAWSRLHDGAATVFVSPVTIAEIWHGLRPAEEKVVSNLLSALPCVPVDGRIGRQAGQYLKVFHKSHGVMLGDALVAATAAIHAIRLWTRNRRHYPMKDLQFFSPAE
ncbi:MAG: type II toxin-antitoxin system VapC family toxin [Acidobacteria bacterium]|nr:type II toxin-antitoxin system VapC family toxin [Acidobacteriota bacterium]